MLELTHGIYRAKTESDRLRRRFFAEEIYRDVTIFPVSIGIAQLAGRIEGEQMALGIRIAFQSLLIGTTAIHLGFDVVTLNVRHFQEIPGLKVDTFTA